MRIEDLRKQVVPFGKIVAGDVFVFEDEFYVKIQNEDENKACNLDDNTIYTFYVNDLVTQVKAKIVIEG